MWNQLIKIFGILFLLVISNQRKQVFENHLKLDKNTKAKTMLYKALVPNMKECNSVKRLMIIWKIW